jgi:AAA domain-containing protein
MRIDDHAPSETTPVLGAWQFHAETPTQARPSLIKGLLPQTGAALLSGQWGTYKTTLALDISVSAMTRLTFADRFRVKCTGGVVYFALEGAGGLQSRVSAIARARGVSEPLPFAWRADCPALTAPRAAKQLADMLDDAAAHLREGFDVPVVLIWIDTVITAAGYTNSGDDNDAAIAQRIMSVLSGLSRHTGALAAGIDHFGKATETGTRGSSAKEGHADTVLALLADREINGTVSNTRLALRKQRDGIAGIEIPFSPPDRAGRHRRGRRPHHQSHHRLGNATDPTSRRPRRQIVEVGPAAAPSGDDRVG